VGLREGGHGAFFCIATATEAVLPVPAALLQSSFYMWGFV
jgi:hypothetical protein